MGFVQCWSVVCSLFLCCCQLITAALFFPTNSAYGIFAAIAVPLDLPNRNVFISYNFEANYNLPYTWTIPPALAGIQDEDILESRKYEAGCENCTDTSEAPPLNTKRDFSANSTTTTTGRPLEDAPTAEQSRERRSLLTRTHFYYILKDKFERSGYSGESCLLRLICESNASGLGDINGVLGTLVHIIFSPSTSMHEHLPLAYYQAEVDGVHDQCEYYAESCQENIIDLISVPLHDIIDSLTNQK